MSSRLCTDPDMELTNKIQLKVNKIIFEAFCNEQSLKNKVCGPCFHLVLEENVRIKKSTYQLQLISSHSGFFPKKNLLSKSIAM